MMKRIFAQSLLILLLSVGFFSVSHAQDPQYSQFYSNLVLLNPAFTGSGIGPRVAMNYRAQWVGIPGYYKQFAVSFDSPISFLGTNQGVGLTFSSDVAGEGDLTRLDIILNYAYQIDINDDHTLRFGLSGGIQQASINFFKLRFPDQIDDRDGFVFPTNEPGLGGGLSESNIRPDVNAGIAYYNPYAWLGVTINHITEPEQRFYPNIPLPPDQLEGAKLPRKFTVTGGLRLPVGGIRNPNRIKISPAFLFKVQGQFFQVDAGVYLDIEPMVFGVWYRHQDALIGLIGFRKGVFSFGYSYDYTISRLTNGISGGSHEVSLVLEFEQKKRRKPMRHKSPPCPRF